LLSIIVPGLELRYHMIIFVVPDAAPAVPEPEEKLPSAEAVHHLFNKRRSFIK
jgi:hypothetical protein